MVRGIEGFREWFRGYEDQYAIIGGTACDLLMTDEGLDFRATKDIDLVLIVEAIDVSFGKRFWEYVLSAGYEHRNKSTGEPQFYRFTNPMSKEYPMMIELFTRKTDVIVLPEDTVLSPLPIDEDVSNLSAILLDDDYYELLKQGRTHVTDVTVLDAPYLILFKIKTWLDLTERKAAGESVDSKNIRKHKNDVFRLTELLDDEQNTLFHVPEVVLTDVREFIKRMASEDVDLKQLGIRGKYSRRILLINYLILECYITETILKECRNGLMNGCMITGKCGQSRLVIGTA